MENKCDHKGHYKYAAVLPSQNLKGMQIIVVLFCENCGDAVAKTINIVKLDVASMTKLPKMPS